MRGREIERILSQQYIICWRIQNVTAKRRTEMGQFLGLCAQNVELCVFFIKNEFYSNRERNDRDDRPRNFKLRQT